MKKPFKIVLTIVVCLFALGLLGGGIAFFTIRNAANAEEYKLGNDTVKSINAVVEKRNVTSISTGFTNGIKTKQITYKSNSVQDDLEKYIQYLRNEGGFSLTNDMNLSQIPSVVQLGKASNDSGKLLIMTIDYNSFGYTIILQKGKGTLSTTKNNI